MNKGFTLLEILLIIAAIAILAAIVIVAINPNRQLAQVRNTTRTSDINTLKSAMQQYNIDNGEFPAGLTNEYQEICAEDASDCTGYFDADTLTPLYLAAIPSDPQATGNGSGYYVALNPNNNRISLQVSAELQEDISVNDFVSPAAFVTTWQTDNPGVSGSNQIQLPLHNGSSYDATVEWGDGTISEITSHDDPDALKTYAQNGMYTVSITGTFGSLRFDNGGDREKIVSLEQWGNISWEYLESAFEGCSNLIVTATDVPNLSLVTNMTQMFERAHNANPDVSAWDVSNVENMTRMFARNDNINPDVSSWDVSNVRSFRNMFWDAESANPDVSSWDTSAAQDMLRMFISAGNANPDVSSWNVPNVVDMDSMFNGSGLSTPNYSNALVNFAAQTTQNDVSLGASGIQYDGSATSARATLEGRGWIIDDGGQL